MPSACFLGRCWNSFCWRCPPNRCTLWVGVRRLGQRRQTLNQLQSFQAPESAPGPSLLSSSTKTPVDATCLRDLSGGARILAGHAADHPLVLELLVHTRQAPLAEDFQSRLDEPSYRPSNRLLVR